MSANASAAAPKPDVRRAWANRRDVPQADLNGTAPLLNIPAGPGLAKTDKQMVGEQQNACWTGYLARFHTMSNVTPAGVRGFVNFISSAVMDVMIRR